MFIYFSANSRFALAYSAQLATCSCELEIWDIEAAIRSSTAELQTEVFQMAILPSPEVWNIETLKSIKFFYYLNFKSLFGARN